MNYGSVCSGIESASAAWHPIGFEAAWFAEIEPFPSAVLAHHYPEVANLGDMTTISSRVLSGEVEAPDVLVGGTPCQAFSVAGLRKSLDDARGQLSIAFVHLADAIDAVRRVSGKPPAIIVWENVPGVFSTKDNAFGCFLAGLAGEECELQPSGKKWSNAGCVYGPKRAVAWRVLDAQYFGVAQRRRRVFVVASARDGADPAAILFERESLRRDTAPSRSTGEKATAGTLRSTDGGSDVDHACAGHLQPVRFRPVNFGGVGGGYAEAEVTNALDAIQGSKQTHLALQPALPIAAYTIQAGALRVNPLSGPDGVGVQDGVAYTLEARAEVQAVCCVHGTQDPCVSDSLAFALGRNAGQENVVAFAENSRGEQEEVTHTLDCTAGSAIQFAMQVRRLTPTEGERLQGFRDGYTQVPYRGKPAADGNRYKAIGNSMAVPVMNWIGRKIQQVCA